MPVDVKPGNVITVAEVRDSKDRRVFCVHRLDLMHPRKSLCCSVAFVLKEVRVFGRMRIRQ